MTRLIGRLALMLIGMSISAMSVAQALMPSQGDVLLVTANTFGNARSQLLLLDTSRTISHLLTDNGGFNFGVSWSPDGAWIGASSTVNGSLQLYRMPAHGGPMQALSDTLNSIGFSDASWLPGGTSIAYTDSDENQAKLQHYDIRTGETTTLYTMPVSNYVAPQWLPDGERMLFLAGETVGDFRLTILDINTQQVTTLLPDAKVFNADISADGQWIAFSAEIRTPRTEVYIVPIDGGEPQNISRNPFFDNAPVWSPDGRMIAYVSNRSGDWQIMLYDVTTEETRQITTEPTETGYHLVWSPDGAWITFVHNGDLFRAHVASGRVESIRLPDNWVVANAPLGAVVYKP